MHPYIAALVQYLRREHPSDQVTRQQFLDDVHRFCHQNIQFYRSLRQSPEFRQEMQSTFGAVCTAADIEGILSRARISVVIEEHKVGDRHYPPSLFFREPDQIDELIDFLMLVENRAPKRRLADARFFCVGSCFATNVAYYLTELGAHIHTSVLAESINSPRNNVDLFHFFDTGERRGLMLRDEVTASIGVDDLRKAFLESDTLILTLGCAYSLVSGATGQPIGMMEAGARFEEPTVSEVVAQLRFIVDVCERHDYREIYMTVSPVPLAGTLIHDGKTYVSDAASKAKLRAAVEELLPGTRVQYIPSFEAFRQGALHSYFPVFGMADGNSRHVNPDMTGRVIQQFVANNFETG